MIRSLIALTVLAVFAHADASAIFITGAGTQITANGGLTLTGGGPAITGAEGNQDYTGTFAANPNQVSLLFDVLNPFITEEVAFTVNATSLATTEYAFAITFTNVNATSQFVMSGFDVGINVTGNAVNARFERFGDPVNPAFASVATGTAAPFAFESPNLAGTSPPGTAGPLRFGGLNGGGGFLDADGSTVTQFFTLDLADGGSGPAQTLNLTFTANPEPSAAALALLALGPLALRRRRRQ